MLLILQNNSNCDDFIWLWPLTLAFLLGSFLGWLLKQLLENKDDCKNKLEEIKTELDACRNDIRIMEESQKIDTRSSLTNIKSESKKQDTVIVDSSKKDNLTKVEGIGPKIQSLLYDAKIYTWKQLSETPIKKLEKILDDAGPRYKMHKPKTWAKQAKLASEGKWEELKKWQDELKGGL